MVFSSVTFLFAFLPCVLILYFIVPSRPAKNVLLLLVSLVFYAWGEPVYVVLMIISILANWFFGLGVGPKEGRSIGFRRAALVLCMVVDLGILGFFKYEGFLAENVNALVGAEVIPDLALPLPIGISFYTLQAVSYIVDVYRGGSVKVQKNPLYLGMYIAMFPQLVAGPIVRYDTIQEQILHRRESLKDFAAGVRLFIVGLAKKILLSNIVAILADRTLSAMGADIGAVGVWAGLLAYTFQIYFDFGGYSDMAIGLGKMFGFQYLRNFNYPYISRSVTEFWRRWHISLSSFFRDYIYIPLGGNRVSQPRWFLNIAIVWALTGFWHGAAWNFILWGVFYGFVLVLEKLFLLKVLEKVPSLVQHLYTILIFMFGWLLFWVEDLGQMGTFIQAMVGQFGLTGASTLWELTAWEYLPVFVICAVASTPVVPYIRFRLTRWAEASVPGAAAADAAQVAAEPGNDALPAVNAEFGAAATPASASASMAPAAASTAAVVPAAPAPAPRFFEADLPNPKHLSTETLCEFPIPAQAPAPKKAVLGLVALAADLALLAMLALAVMSVVSGSFNPFIYFRF